MEDKFEVRNARIESELKGLGKTIAGKLPDGWGFALLIFSFGDGGSTFYISNAQRDDMVKAMHEFMERQSNGRID